MEERTFERTKKKIYKWAVDKSMIKKENKNKLCKKE